MKKVLDQKKVISKEWSLGKVFNPFNSFKLLAQVERWRCIKEGYTLPPPVSITIDPANNCNYKCIWCNAESVINRKKQLSKIAMKKIIDILSEWSCDEKYKVKTVCIAGGGEPLLNKNVGFLIDELVSSGINVGVVTNGRFIDNFIESLSKCHWVSVSVDSGTAETFSKLKRTTLLEFDKVIENIQMLIDYSNRNKTFLVTPSLSSGVTYKFLLHEKNVHEVKIAAKIAKLIGCRSMHIRPVGRPWHQVEPILFDDKKIAMFHKQVIEARKFEDENFSIYGITHKFTISFQPKNNFLKCHAIFMTAVFMPPYLEDYNDSFTLGLCCDRRGDLGLELSRNLMSLKDVLEKWGSKYHWEIQNGIKLNECPRCTYSPHNKIYQEVICKDNMSIDFI